MIAALENRIAKLREEIAKETAIIDAAVAAHQIGNGYWQRRHSLQCQLRVACAIRDAISEVQV